MTSDQDTSGAEAVAHVEALRKAIAEACDDATSLLVLMQPPGHNGDDGRIYGAKHLANRLARMIDRPPPFPSDIHGYLCPSDAYGQPL